MLGKFNLIRSRLILAQALLEESDALPGDEGYKTNASDGSVHHPRHEREALVVYLLLTCFDLLGQHRRYLTFHDWLCSKKSKILQERRAALENLDIGSANPVESSRKLFESYNRIYGASKAFNAGIDELPPDANAHLLNSVSVVVRNPESLKPENKNASYLGTPISDEDKLKKIKLRYLYSLRNAFTHQLSQVHFSSMPSMEFLVNSLKRPKSDTRIDCASWGVIVNGDEVIYGQHHEQNDQYVYNLAEWPFVLFEVLYAAIGEEFNREQIKLNMYVLAMGNTFIPSIPHAELPATLKLGFGVIPRRWRS